MGMYMEDSDKRKWLQEVGSFIDCGVEPTTINFKDVPENSMIVCLVDNGAFLAAGVAFDEREFEVFNKEDGRWKEWYFVSRSELAEKCPMWKEYTGENK